MGVDHNGQLHRLFQGGHQVKGLLGAHDAGHILDADGVAAHGLQPPAQVHKGIQAVNGAGGVAQGAGYVGAGLDALVHCHLDVPQIIEGVEHTDDVDAALHALAHKGPDDVVGIMLVAQQVLAPQQHLQPGVFHVLADGAQPLPGILVQIPQAAVKGGAAPALERVIPGLVHGLQDGQKIADGHPRGHQRLLSVPQHRFRDLNFHI